LKILGWRIPFTKQTDQNTVTPIGTTYTLQSKFGTIFESFGGSWQGNLVLDGSQQLTAFSAVYACLRLISQDVAKIRLLLRRLQNSGVWLETSSAAFSPVLRKPNGYQTRMQFIESWMLSKLIAGNTYVLKERDERNVVTAMHVLDAGRVKALVGPDGQVYYDVQEDPLSGVGGKIRVPSSEIMHDRAPCLDHRLLGIPPIYAAAMSGTQGRKIQTNASKFFENMSRPSGQLTAPGRIAPETADRLKREFEEGFGGAKLGRIFVSGDGLKFEPLTMPADQAQLVEQLGWSVQDVCRAFGVPLYKVAAQEDVKVDPAMKQEYYDTTLYPYMEAAELLLDEGLSLPSDLEVKFDVEELTRLDPKARYEKYEIGTKSGVLAPNEARGSENLPPVDGGSQPMMQQQNWPLPELEKFHAQELKAQLQPKPAPATPAVPAAEPEGDEVDAEEEMRALLARVKEGLHA